MKENFAIKLRELRKASGMTQEQLAAEFGVSVQAVSKWETAASYPDIELMPRIADLFGVSLDELLRDVKNEKNIEAGEEIQTDAEQQCDAACNPESVEVEYEDENGEKRTKKYIKGARLCLYPPGFHIFRWSKGIKKPDVSIVEYKKAKEKASSGKLTFTKTVALEDHESDFKNTLQYEYYNSMRK